jgi:hypothetical protein
MVALTYCLPKPAKTTGEVQSEILRCKGAGRLVAPTSLGLGDAREVRIGRAVWGTTLRTPRGANPSDTIYLGWWCAQSDTNRSPVGNSLRTGKLTGNFAILVPQERISLRETAVPQRLLVKFPTQINRENISGNREFLAGNRECSRKIGFGGRSPGSP